MKLAFVVQRYGSQINGGSELHCRWVAERLAAKGHKVDVWTTCALDYTTWENHYPPGKDSLNGVDIFRFPVAYARSPQIFDRIYDLLTVRLQAAQSSSSWKSWPFLKHPQNSHKKKIYRFQEDPLWNSVGSDLETLWMKEQGPFAPELWKTLETQQNQYEAIFFFTYHYATTFYSLPLCYKKAVLIPTLHDDISAHFSLFKDFFRWPRKIFFNTESEMKLAYHLFPQMTTSCQVVGVGLDPISCPEGSSRLWSRWKIKPQEYIIYVGRIDPSKGSQLLFSYFAAYKKRYPSSLKLVVVGKWHQTLVEHPDVIALGFLPEEEKLILLSQAAVLVNPSPFESLSIILLEAWNLGVPVLVNGHNDVMLRQCESSQGGLAFFDEQTFQDHLAQIMSDTQLRRLWGEKGKAFVRSHYQWQKVLSAYETAAKQMSSLEGHKNRDWGSLLKELQNFRDYANLKKELELAPISFKEPSLTEAMGQCLHASQEPHLLGSSRIILRLKKILSFFLRPIFRLLLVKQTNFSQHVISLAETVPILEARLKNATLALEKLKTCSKLPYEDEKP